MRLLGCLMVILLWVHPAAADTVIPLEAQRAALQQRVTARWEALIQGDFAAAYDFNSPAYRKLYSFDAFRRRFGQQITWRRIKIQGIDFKEDETARVGIDLYFMYHEGQRGAPVETVTYLHESWMQVDGQWWYVVSD